jgi:hypothetical protein
VATFTIANALGLPGVDRPVRVETLAGAAEAAAVNESEAYSVRGYREMEARAAQLANLA